MNPSSEVGAAPSYTGPREECSSSMVLLSGLATTALTLAGVYLLDRNIEDFHIMGWYANYVLPVGAVLVGIAASSGYGIASWVTGIKITKRLLWTVLVLQLLAYFAAQYIEFSNLHLVYSDTGRPVSFFTWFDFTARLFAWKQDNGTMGQPLGAWGYVFRGLEILGFAAAGLIVPGVLFKAPYCAECQRYMKTRQLVLIPASVKARRVKKSDVAAAAAYQTEQTQALNSGQKTLAELQKLAEANSAADFQKRMEELRPGRKAAGKLPGRFSVDLVHCKRCFQGQLVGKLQVGQGNHIKSTEVGRTAIHPEFARTICFSR